MKGARYSGVARPTSCAPRGLSVRRKTAPTVHQATVSLVANLSHHSRTAMRRVCICVLPTKGARVSCASWWVLLRDVLQDDFVDLPTPRYGIIVVVIEQLPGLWRWIDEDPAFECKVLVQAVDLILVEYRVHVFRDIDVEFVVGNPLTLHDFDDDLQIVKDHGDLPALAMKHLANHIPHRLSPSDDKKCNKTLPGVERVTKDAFGVQS